MKKREYTHSSETRRLAGLLQKKWHPRTPLAEKESAQRIIDMTKRDMNIELWAELLQNALEYIRDGLTPSED